ncbi:NADH dehydrogenase [ubiquinone] 1 beta subcomplex subunit 7 [Teleopsis dalmanni]|uniref:NADH dehydrogenase [ubiquinone] 1 beta subcomplex subunit 7 n=1 Tax=Teleopsis dalmanni TaxID=139649 RepID=UPI0018CE5025|nr:NADH dehydrogenase [ubiquinone] 1 beta subcomplex subunit 7 [Teleopsis dalmanni]
MGNAIARYRNPDVTPGPDCEITFDPLLGLANRKERVMIATEEQMRSAKLAPEDRDYCAHKLLEYRSCRADTFPFVYKCAHEKHEYLTCEYEDYVLRLKEYERERRLLERQKRINAQAAA